MLSAQAQKLTPPGDLQEAPAVLGHFINGQNVPGQSGRFGPVYNPATGAETAQVALASKDETQAAIAAADAAFDGWAAVTPIKRARIMARYRDLLERDADKIAAMISREHGKTVDDAKGELTRGIEVVEYCSGAPTLLKSDYNENVGTGVDCHTIRQPLGVVAGITPFNFPAMVPMWMFPVALTCGNTFVLKPSEKDPGAALYLAELLQEAGLPEGVFNVVNGDREAVNTLLDDDRVEAISFVGSTPVAEYIYKTGAANGKRVQALGGAKNHMIILPDADLDKAVDALMGAAYGAAGERCMAISVAVPVGDVAGPLIKRLEEKIDALRVAPGDDPAADMGPLITREAQERVKSYISKGVEEGATLLRDGRDTRVDGYENGYFVGPTLFDHVTKDMCIYTDEIFGPVLSVVRAGTYEDALALVNDHEFGNGTSLFTSNGNAARHFCEKVRAGMVGVNVPIPVPVAYHSFGGWKRSLFGGHHIYGPEGIRFYTRLKTMTTRWADDVSELSFSMPTTG